jgi:hypothetical protein
LKPQPKGLTMRLVGAPGALLASSTSGSLDHCHVTQKDQNAVQSVIHDLQKLARLHA